MSFCFAKQLICRTKQALGIKLGCSSQVTQLSLEVYPISRPEKWFLRHLCGFWRIKVDFLWGKRDKTWKWYLHEPVQFDQNITTHKTDTAIAGNKVQILVSVLHQNIVNMSTLENFFVTEMVCSMTIWSSKIRMFKVRNLQSYRICHRLG